MSAPDRLAAIRELLASEVFRSLRWCCEDDCEDARCPACLTGADLAAEVDRLRAGADRAHELGNEVMALREQLHRALRAVAAPTEGGTDE